jgi:hypothetical protein
MSGSAVRGTSTVHAHSEHLATSVERAAPAALFSTWRFHGGLFKASCLMIGDLAN